MKVTDPTHKFTLAGKRYSFTRSQLENAAKNQLPRRIDKYKVSLRGAYYPPKQLVELLTAEHPINFTTMDAQRILKGFGYKTEVAEQSDEAESAEGRTLSEQYLEHYLQTNGYFEFEFEPEHAGTTRKPDYRLTVGGEHILLEVKEFLVSGKDFIGGPFGDGVRARAVPMPYAPIRQKIDDAREKYRDLKGQVCCLVLYNVNKPLLSLDTEMIYGAMLGDITFNVPFNPATQEFDDSQTTKVYGRNGKCTENRNTTISAVIVLEPLMIGERRLHCEINRIKRETNRYKLGWDELYAERDKARGTERDPSIFQWRVVVHENPYATNKLPDKFFQGRFDERYGGQDGRIERRYVGPGVQELEALENRWSPFWPNFRDLPPRKNRLDVEPSGGM